MERLLPGTTLTCTPGKEGDAFSVLEPVFTVSGGGLTLSQVSELTGLTPTAIQNWVKRGWVANPVNKKYDEIRVARIVLINLLRDAMQLDRIARLLAYVNGSVNDRSDDSMQDPYLYSLICAAIFRIEDGERAGGRWLQNLVAKFLSAYPSPVADAKQRLTKALTVMLLSVEASVRMKQAGDMYTELMKEGSV